jgi:tetratricopeptide (TPR) repeat protein
MMPQRLITTSLLAAAGLMGASCSQTTRSSREAIISYQTGDYGTAAGILRGEIARKDENFVLTNCRFGSAALASGDLDGAENAFLAAYEVMNGVKTNDGGRTMGAAVVFEGIKVWKGEPFERAMAHYYLGLIYLLKNDYENARAAFQNSLFKVREYASKDDLEHYTEAESNFALGYLGLGICNLRMGKTDLANASFQKAVSINPGLRQVVTDLTRPGVNTLIFVDAGMGPRKEGKGWYNEESAFFPTPAEVGPIPGILAYVDGQPANNPQVPFATVDTLAMAQQQQWQDIDTLKKVKAALGTGMMAAGTGMAAYGANRHDEGLMWAGIGTAVAGALVSASSQSDVRSWDMLPRTVYLVPLALPPGQHQIMVQAGGGQSAPLQAAIRPAAPGGGQDHVFYFRVP